KPITMGACADPGEPGRRIAPRRRYFLYPCQEPFAPTASARREFCHRAPRDLSFGGVAPEVKGLRVTATTSEQLLAIPDRSPSLGDEGREALKHRVHDRLLRQLDLSQVKQLPDEHRRGELQLVIERFLAAEDVKIHPADRKDLVDDLLDELLGLG